MLVPLCVMLLFSVAGFVWPLVLLLHDVALLLILALAGFVQPAILVLLAASPLLRVLEAGSVPLVPVLSVALLLVLVWT